MRNFTNFKTTLEAKLQARLNATPGKVPPISYIDFTNDVKDSLDALSGFGSYRMQTFTYDLILADMKSVTTWEEITKINLNKLYTLFLKFDIGYIKQMAQMSNKPKRLKDYYNETDITPIF